MSFGGSVSVAERVAPEVTVIDVATVRPPMVSSFEPDGTLCLKIAPDVYVKGDRAQLTDWFGEAGLTLADSFFDDLEAEVNRGIRAATRHANAARDLERA